MRVKAALGQATVLQAEMDQLKAQHAEELNLREQQHAALQQSLREEQESCAAMRGQLCSMQEDAVRSGLQQEDQFNDLAHTQLSPLVATGLVP